MFKKQRIKLPEQSEHITLRETINELPAAAERLTAEDPTEQLAVEHLTANDPTEQTAMDQPGDPALQEKTDEDAAYKSKSHSNLSDADLIHLAKHPNTPESEWLQACTELNQRNENQISRQNKSPNQKLRMLVFGTTLLFFVTIAFWQMYPLSKVPVNSTTGGSATPYLLSSAQYKSDELKQRAIIRLAQAIAERGWTDSKAASYLAVNESGITAIMRREKSTFNMEALNKMLFAMGQSTVFPVIPTTKESQQTVAYFTRIIDINPHNSRAFNERASAYENLHQFDLAIADLTRYVEMEPTRPGPRNNLALAYESAGRYPEALQQFNELHSLFPDYEIYQNRAMVFDALEEYDKALSDSTKAIQMMQSQRPGPYWNRALLYEKLGKFQEAIADCKKVLEIDPTYKSALEKIASLKQKTQD